jgi:uncharacterized membrane protein
VACLDVAIRVSAARPRVAKAAAEGLRGDFAYLFAFCNVSDVGILITCFDVITSLVSLVYWGFRCEKVTSHG